MAVGPTGERGWRATAGLLLFVSALFVSALSAAGCGAPDFTYVTNSAERTYLKVPAAWRQIDGRELGAVLQLDPGLAPADQGIWLEGYDADAVPSAEHLFGRDAPAPAVFVSVQDVPLAARGKLSLDDLRDLFHPVSAAGREAMGQNLALSDFGLLSDEVLTPGGGLHGVHVVYRYRMAGGPPQVVDKTAYLNDDASKVYVVLARCSTECFVKRRDEINTVVASFTIREKKS